MKTLRVIGILAVIVLAVIAVSVLPSSDGLPTARPGIVVEEDSAAGEPSAAVVQGVDGGAIALPEISTAGDAPSETGLGTMEAEPSPAPAPPPDPAPAPRGNDSGSPSSSSTRPAQPQPTRPSGVCEWDDGELECDDDGDDDDDDDDDD